MTHQPDFYDLIRAAGEHNDGTRRDFAAYVQQWVILAHENELDLLAGAITLAYQSMDDGTTRGLE